MLSREEIMADDNSGGITGIVAIVALVLLVAVGFIVLRGGYGRGPSHTTDTHEYKIDLKGPSSQGAN
jgi:hypothetical protein